MLNRVANIFAVLTFGLLAVILWLGTVAIHDFNNPNLASGNSRIFVREYQRHANYTIGEYKGSLIGYQTHYVTCGYGSLKTLPAGQKIGEVLEVSPRVYGRIEKHEHIPFWIYHPIPTDELQRFGLGNGIEKNVDQPDFEWGSSTRRICQIDASGFWTASKDLIASLI